MSSTLALQIDALTELAQNQQMAPVLGALLLLCPLFTVLAKVVLQFTNAKGMWKATDKISVTMMFLAAAGAGVILAGFLKPDPTGDKDNYQQAGATWLVFGRDNAQQMLDAVPGPAISVDSFKNRIRSDEMARERMEQAKIDERMHGISLGKKRKELRIAMAGGAPTAAIEKDILVIEESIEAARTRAEEARQQLGEGLALPKRDADLMVSVLGGMAVRSVRPGEDPSQVELSKEAVQEELELRWRRDHQRWEVNVGAEFNNLTAIMFFMVTFICALIHLYSTGYMHGDPRYPRFFSYISLFTFGMMGLVISDNLLTLYMFWEIMGLCSYLLIGFYFEKDSAAKASLKAFMVTRIGDVGMFVGMMVLFLKTGTFNFNELYDSIALLYQEDPAGTAVWLTTAGILLFLGPVGKSAQFPLHVWLPDAMEGPTPVSAMIHAATMVSAGVYLTGKFYPLMTPECLFIVAGIGAFTAIFAASIALVQNDIKKVLAYSTISQLGFMICSIGVGAWTAAMFHMLTHAFFKACLFLGSGSVIHAVHTQDMREMGGLRKKLPWTHLTFLISTLSIAGFPMLAGFFSKDEIIKGALMLAKYQHAGWAYCYYAVLLAAATMTAFYMFRLVFMTFYGKPRDEEKYDHAHESPATMVAPLVLLAVFAVFGGYFPIREYVKEARPVTDTSSYIRTVEEARAEYEQLEAEVAAWSPHDTGEVRIHKQEQLAEAREHLEHFEHMEHEAHVMALYTSVPAGLFGIFLAMLMYLWGTINPAAIAGACKPVYKLLENKYYIDETYDRFFVHSLLLANQILNIIDKVLIDGLVNLSALVVRLFAWVFGLIDKYVVDGAVDGVGELCQNFSAGLAELQNGKVQYYFVASAFLLVVIVVILAATGATPFDIGQWFAAK